MDMPILLVRAVVVLVVLVRIRRCLYLALAV